MMNLVKTIADTLARSRTRKLLTRILAVAVVFATTYSLVLPAITQTAPTLDAEMEGVRVRVNADAGTVPMDASLALKQVLLPDDPEDSAQLRRLTAEEVEQILAAALDGEEDQQAEILRALDISLEHNGVEIEPYGAVSLILQSGLIRDANSPVIVHLDDEGNAERLNVLNEDGEITVSTDAAEAPDGTPPEDAEPLPDSSENPDPADSPETNPETVPEEGEGSEADPNEPAVTDPGETAPEGSAPETQPALPTSPSKPAPAPETNPGDSAPAEPDAGDNEPDVPSEDAGPVEDEASSPETDPNAPDSDASVPGDDVIGSDPSEEEDSQIDSDSSVPTTDWTILSSSIPPLRRKLRRSPIFPRLMPSRVIPLSLNLKRVFLKARRPPMATVLTRSPRKAKLRKRVDRPRTAVGVGQIARRSMPLTSAYVRT